MEYVDRQQHEGEPCPICGAPIPCPKCLNDLRNDEGE